MNYSRSNYQAGMAMITALLILIALTLVVLSGSRNTTMQLRMASNLQSRVEAVETAQAGLDYAYYLGTTSLRTTDTKICTKSHPDNPKGECVRDINMPNPLLDDATNAPSKLMIQNTGSGYEEGTSYTLGKKAYFLVESTFDDTNNGRGRAKLVSGMKILELTPE